MKQDDKSNVGYWSEQQRIRQGKEITHMTCAPEKHLCPWLQTPLPAHSPHSLRHKLFSSSTSPLAAGTVGGIVDRATDLVHGRTGW